MEFTLLSIFVLFIAFSPSSGVASEGRYKKKCSLYSIPEGATTIEDHPSPLAGGRLRGASASDRDTLRKTLSAPELTREVSPLPCESERALSVGYDGLSSLYVDFPFGDWVALETTEFGCLGDEIWRNHKAFPWGTTKEDKHGPVDADLSPGMTTWRSVERWECQNFAGIVNKIRKESARARTAVSMFEGDIGDR